MSEFPLPNPLNNLTESKQKAIDRVTEIIRKEVNPEKIILFGSYAKGKQVTDRYVSENITYEYLSDFDFLVVMAGDSLEENEIEYQLLDKVDYLRQPVNIIVHDIKTINKELEVGQYFFKEIIETGVVLYDTGFYEFAEPRELTPEERKQLRQADFDHWFKLGNEFLIDAGHARNRESHKHSAFLLHQAVENYYYTFHLVYTGYKPKTHKLARLRQLAKSYSEEYYHLFPIKHNKSEAKLFDLLKKGYKDARFKREYNISKEQLEQLIVRVEKMNQLTERLCKEHIASIA